MPPETSTTNTVISSLLSLLPPFNPTQPTDPSLHQQTFYLNVLPFYFTPRNGYHITTTVFAAPILGKSIVHVDVHSHRSYNDPSQPEPYSHLHLRVVCAPDPFITGKADDALLDAYLCVERPDLDTRPALSPWEQPVIIISRVDVGGDICARSVEWKGNAMYIASSLQRVNLCSDGGQAHFHLRLAEWAEEGEFVVARASRGRRPKSRVQQRTEAQSTQ
ncbi:hypothetical protein FKW77_007675 [Venturia effusa]|uniref:Uncharacterized protein n=1 Tax=Venturia effusa TaxID=50376 RepID=A0A517L9L3_9PEZI|nr:hypothetical protein FKW77_007675 [Venturia effusa]